MKKLFGWFLAIVTSANMLAFASTPAVKAKIAVAEEEVVAFTEEEQVAIVIEEPDTVEEVKQ